MSLIAYLVGYLVFSFIITFIFSCACGLTGPLKDRRKGDRRKVIRHNQLDRRVSNKFHIFSMS